MNLRPSTPQLPRILSDSSRKEPEGFFIGKFSSPLKENNPFLESKPCSEMLMLSSLAAMQHPNTSKKKRRVSKGRSLNLELSPSVGIPRPIGRQYGPPPSPEFSAKSQQMSELSIIGKDKLEMYAWFLMYRYVFLLPFRWILLWY